MLKKQKGYSIATKSVKAKLVRNGFDFHETKSAYNEMVRFYFLSVDEDPAGLSIPVKENGGWRYYELKTQEHPFVKGNNLHSNEPQFVKVLELGSLGILITNAGLHVLKSKNIINLQFSQEHLTLTHSTTRECGKRMMDSLSF